MQLSKRKFLVMGKQNPSKLTYILGVLTSFSVQSGKVINYDKTLTSPLSLIPLNIANANGSRPEIKKSKLKDITLKTPTCTSLAEV